MLLGHIDSVAVDRIGGWVFDTERSDRRVDIAIYVDGQKAAEVTCDRERPDLQQKGRYGDGRHGFLHQFNPPLTVATDRTVTVRHVPTGFQVANGRYTVGSGGIRQMQGPAASRLEQYMRIPRPGNTRDLFEILALYDSNFELYDLLANVDFEDWGPREAYYCVFGRYPDARQPPERSENARDVVNALMLSPEYQNAILPIFLDAYADKQRLLFIHIPKCAGSDLSRHLITKYPSISQRISESAWTSKEEFFSCLRDIVLRMRFSSKVFVRGHISLDYYCENGLVRPRDEVFTILRDPSQIPISQVNYILTRFSANRDRERPDPDAAHWLEMLQLTSIPDLKNPRTCSELGMRILRDPRLVPSNTLCHWLGGGSAAAVIERLASHRIEVTETQRYNAWLRERWGISSSTRDNASESFILASDLGPKDAAYVNDLITDDMTLYEKVDSCLSRLGRNSINCGSLD